MARWGVGDGSPRPHPPRPASGERAPAACPKDGRSGARERPTPDVPHPDKRCPPRAPSCRLHSAPSQLSRARAVGLVTGPYADTPRTDSQCVAGPSCTPHRRVVGRGRAPNTGRPTTRQEAPPPGALVPPPHCAKPARKSTRLGVGDRSPRPQPRHQQPVGGAGPGRRPEGLAVGRERAPNRGRPTPRQEAPPQRAPTCRLHSGQSELLRALARARAVGFVTGPHTHSPRTRSQLVAGPGCTPQGREVGRGRALNPGCPTTRQVAAPLPGRRCTAPTARKASSEERGL